MIDFCNIYPRRGLSLYSIIRLFPQKPSLMSFQKSKQTVSARPSLSICLQLLQRTVRFVRQKLRWLFSNRSYSCACSQILYWSLYRSDSQPEIFACFSVVWHWAVYACFLSPLLLCPLNPGFKIVQFLKAVVTCFTFACVGFQNLRKPETSSTTQPRGGLSFNVFSLIFGESGY